LSIWNERSLTEKIAFILGLIGAILGAIVWGGHHWGGGLLWGLIQLDDFYKPDTQLYTLIYYIFLFIPACLAFTSVLFNKKYLMFLAVFLHLPIGDFIGGMPAGLGSFTTIQIVWFLYAISAVLMTVKIKTKDNQNIGFHIENPK
jgi:hypothetical protein